MSVSTECDDRPVHHSPEQQPIIHYEMSVVRWLENEYAWIDAKFGIKKSRVEAPPKPVEEAQQYDDVRR